MYSFDEIANSSECKLNPRTTQDFISSNKVLKQTEKYYSVKLLKQTNWIKKLITLFNDDGDWNNRQKQMKTSVIF